MKWKIIDSLASPATGTFFSAAASPRGIKLILWYQSDFFIRPGHTLSTGDIGTAINGRRKKIKIIHTLPFYPAVWTNLLKKTGCPGNSPDFKGPCINLPDCQFAQCPYGIKNSAPALK